MTALLLVGGYLLVEAISRFVSPTPVQGWPVVIVAGVALVIDILTALIIARGARHSLNIRAAFLHNVTDALASVGVIVAGTLILLYDLIGRGSAGDGGDFRLRHLPGAWGCCRAPFAC